MKIYLFSRPIPSIGVADIEELLKAVENENLDYAINREFAEHIGKLAGRKIPSGKIYDLLPPDTDCDSSVMVSFGGDGTFLEAVRRLSGNSMPLTGINCGHLGFLSNIPRNNLSVIFSEIRQGHYSIERRTMIEAQGDFDKRPSYPYAFNEFSIQRADAAMIYVDTFADDQMVARYVGDGVILSTPSGSTAYSLSVGGPIIAPECNCFALSPIAPHNLTMRPIVIPDTTNLKFTVSTRADNAIVTLDNRTYKVHNGATFCLSKAKKSVFLIKFQNISFFDTLRNKMMWGLDPREK